jgi:ribosome-associated protein
MYNSIKKISAKNEINTQHPLMAKKKKVVSTKKTAGKSAVKSVKKATPKKATVKKKASSKATVGKVRSTKATGKVNTAKAKLAKSTKTVVVKKAAKTTKGNVPSLKAQRTKKVALKKAAGVKKAKPVAKKASSAKPVKKAIAGKKKTVVKKASSTKATVSKSVKKTVTKKKAVVAKKVAAPKKATVTKAAAVVKKATTVKKTSTPAKATADKVHTTKAAAAKPAKTAGSNGTTKTSFVKNFALTSTSDLASEKEKESAKVNTQEPFSEDGGTTTPEIAVKPHLRVAEPKKKEIKHTITDPSVDPVKHLADIAVEGILEVKGRNISVLNLKNIHNRVCDYFIICQADSNTQVNAIAGSVEEMVKKITGERPYRKEGFENAEWILVDYVTVVVHIFQSQIRNFYNLESLWADAEITELAFD